MRRIQKDGSVRASKDYDEYVEIDPVTMMTSRQVTKVYRVNLQVIGKKHPLIPRRFK